MDISLNNIIITLSSINNNSLVPSKIMNFSDCPKNGFLQIGSFKSQSKELFHLLNLILLNLFQFRVVFPFISLLLPCRYWVINPVECPTFWGCLNLPCSKLVPLFPAFFYKMGSKSTEAWLKFKSIYLRKN